MALKVIEMLDCNLCQVRRARRTLWGRDINSSHKVDIFIGMDMDMDMGIRSQPRCLRALNKHSY